MTTPGDAEVRALHPSYAFGTFGSMSICLLNGSVTPERVAFVIEECRRQCAAHPQGGGFLLGIGPSTGLPPPAVRAEASQAFSEMAPFIHTAAVVIHGSGFVAATARSVMSVIFLATRTRLPMKVFSNVHDAVAWQVEASKDPGLDARAYEGAVRGLIEKFREHRRNTPGSMSPKPEHE